MVCKEELPRQQIITEMLKRNEIRSTKRLLRKLIGLAGCLVLLQFPRCILDSFLMESVTIVGK
jgi:hypothetical protein